MALVVLVFVGNMVEVLLVFVVLVLVVKIGGSVKSVGSVGFGSEW